MPRDAERAKKVEFGPAYYIIESTFLVPARSKVRTLAESNFPGARAIVIASTTTGRAAARFLTQGSIEEVRSVDEMTAMAKAGSAIVCAVTRCIRYTAAGHARRARARWRLQQTGICCAVPKGRTGALELSVNSSRRRRPTASCAKRLDIHGFKDAEVAPAA